MVDTLQQLLNVWSMGRIRCRHIMLSVSMPVDNFVAATLEVWGKSILHQADMLASVGTFGLFFVQTVSIRSRDDMPVWLPHCTRVQGTLLVFTWKIITFCFVQMQQFDKLHTSSQKGVDTNPRWLSSYTGTVASHTSKQIGFFNLTFSLTHTTETSQTWNARFDSLLVTWSARPKYKTVGFK